MKAKPKAKRTDKRETERAETTRGAQAAQGAAANGAKRARPVWVDESDAEWIEDFDKPSAHLYICACAFIRDVSAAAYENGDNDLLLREGVPDALDFISRGAFINDAGSYDTMLEDWRRTQERKRRTAAKYEKMTDAEHILYRVQFWEMFDETKTPDEEKRKFRLDVLGEDASKRELLRNIKSLYGGAQSADKLMMFDKLTDALIIGYCRDEKPSPARVRADWLNSTFILAGAAFARWFEIAALPESQAIKEVRGRIADNFGVFPAPFAVGDVFGHEAVELNTDELRKIVFVARAMARDNGRQYTEKQHGSAGDVIGQRRGDGGIIKGIAGQWAKAHGVTEYTGESFKYYGRLIRRGNAGAQWADIAAIIESVEPDGAAHLSAHWRGKFAGKFSSENRESLKAFLDDVRPVRNCERAGAGWVHLEHKPSAKTRVAACGVCDKFATASTTAAR